MFLASQRREDQLLQQVLDQQRIEAEFLRMLTTHLEHIFLTRIVASRGAAALLVSADVTNQPLPFGHEFDNLAIDCRK